MNKRRINENFLQNSSSPDDDKFLLFQLLSQTKKQNSKYVQTGSRTCQCRGLKEPFYQDAFPLVSDDAYYWNTLRTQVLCNKGNFRRRMQDLTFKVTGNEGDTESSNTKLNGILQFGSHTGGPVTGFFGRSGFGDLIYVQGIQVDGQTLYNVVLSLCIYSVGSNYDREYAYVSPNADLNNFSILRGTLSSSEANPFRGDVKGVRLQFFSRTYNGPHMRIFSPVNI